MISVDTVHQRPPTTTTRATALGSMGHEFNRYSKHSQRDHQEVKQRKQQGHKGKGKPKETSIPSPEKISTNQKVRIHCSKADKSTPITKGAHKECSGSIDKPLFSYLKANNYSNRAQKVKKSEGR